MAMKLVNSMTKKIIRVEYNPVGLVKNRMGA